MYHKSVICRLMQTFTADTPANFLRLFIYAVLVLIFTMGMIGIHHNQFVVTLAKSLRPQTTFANNSNNNNLGNPSKTSINDIGLHINANNIQDWNDTENNLKIQFIYLPEYPLAGNITKLIFHVQSLQTGSYLKNLVASITIINNLTIAKIDVIKDTNGAFSRFTNIPAANGIFSLKYRFLEEGRHQVIVNIRSGNFSFALASFSVVVQPSFPNL
jgi:hypothetical protein